MGRIKTLTLIVVFMITLSNKVLSGSDTLTGDWIVQWDNETDNKNVLFLSANEGRITGTYFSDSDASCSVTGNLREQDRQFSLTIVCPDWDIRMQGTGSADWKNSSGDYQAYVKSQGRFVMRNMH
jgi:hypothetical protein